MSAQMLLNSATSTISSTTQPQTDTGVVKGALLFTGTATVVAATLLAQTLPGPVPDGATAFALPISALQTSAIVCAFAAATPAGAILTLNITAPVSGIVQWFVFA